VKSLNTKGHHDVGAICCWKCGNQMYIPKQDKEEYINMLERFKINQINHATIIKSGEGINGLWFLIKKNPEDTIDQFEKRLRDLRKLGFQVLPPNQPTDESTRLISEKGFYLFCTDLNCDVEIDLNQVEPSRKNALKYHHMVNNILHT
jgi:hypothetical protein